MMQQDEPLPKLRSMASDVAADRGGMRTSSLQQHKHGRPRSPVIGAKSGMDCWDSVTSLEHFDVADAQIRGSAPIFFMHGVGLGLVSPLHAYLDLLVHRQSLHLSLCTSSHSVSRRAARH